VHRGIEFLNEKIPGWQDKINPEILDMGSSYYCILGQLFETEFKSLNNTEYFSPYNYGVKVGFSEIETYVEAANHGFDSQFPDDEYDYSDDYDTICYAELKEEWLKALKE
jgi:hypothetical protein